MQLTLPTIEQQRMDQNGVADARPRATTRSRIAVTALCLAAMVAIGAAAARAGSCRVLVALGSVDIESSPVGMSMRISGNWEFDNLIQVVSGLSFNVLLAREDNFVLLHYPDQSFTGNVPGLAAELDEGFDGKDIVSVEAAGVALPAARIVSLEAQRIKLTSPVPPGEGPITVVAYLVLDGDYISPIISNTITRSLDMLPVRRSDDDGSGTEPDVPSEPAPPAPPTEDPPAAESAK
jgi:hypothetical protein